MSYYDEPTFDDQKIISLVIGSIGVFILLIGLSVFLGSIAFFFTSLGALLIGDAFVILKGYLLETKKK